MAPRARRIFTPEPVVVTAAATTTEVLPERAFLMIAVEGVETSDERIWEPGSLTWRGDAGNAPFPFLDPPLSLTQTHDDQQLVGRIDAVGRTDDLAPLQVELAADQMDAVFTAAVGTTGQFVVGLVTFDLGLDADGNLVDPEALGRAAARQVANQFLNGVSMEVGDVTVEFECLQIETEPDGWEWCAKERMRFTASRIGNVTLTPFAAFQEAQVLATSGDGGEAAPVLELLTASASADGRMWVPCPVGDQLNRAAPRVEVRASAAAPGVSRETGAPPAAAFRVPEPEPGGFIDLPSGRLPADEYLIEQPDEFGLVEAGQRLAVPLTITPAGEVFGHAARWGQCHVGYPDECVTAPSSACGYARFHVGTTLTREGERLSVGTLTIGCDHAPGGMVAADARDHYANSGFGWAHVRATDGVFGPWVCGMVRPDITPDELAVIEGTALSGDWRRQDGHLEMIGLLSVNYPGFAIVRDVLVASGQRMPVAAPQRLQLTVGAGEVQSLVASGIVRPRKAHAGGCGCGGAKASPLERRLARLEATVAALGLDDQAIAAIAARM